MNDSSPRHAAPLLEVDHQITGAGPIAVYGHGLFSSRAVERRQGVFDWSPIVSAGFSLVRYDARGHGRSPGSRDPADHTFAARGGHLLRLLDHLGATRPVHALGSSMGSAAVLWAAVTAPERFGRLVLVIPPTAWEARAESAATYRQWAEETARGGAGAWAAEQAAADPPPVLAEVPGYAHRPDVAEDLLPAVLRGAAASDLPAPEALRALTHPTLVLCWEKDPGHPVATGHRLAGLLPNARLEVAGTLREIRTWGAAAAAFLREEAA
ncbi:alpha/beta fold hydrolase [Streptomyces hoynatensis]|uniref:Alpha/beta fold hydrolase n=1 Tax=Streptomyces hoynatensis TaxID=1141874 RepID=A0A3A9YPC1_9ACTN|nr:alpha/beta fold hydrolase [Streptomyces hoynatensis]RKN37981.1 alpha/beta fold hydrolase [Streptomyces hoynatensis]